MILDLDQYAHVKVLEIFNLAEAKKTGQIVAKKIAEQFTVECQPIRVYDIEDEPADTNETEIDSNERYLERSEETVRQRNVSEVRMLFFSCIWRSPDNCSLVAHLSLKLMIVVELWQITSPPPVERPKKLKNPVSKKRKEAEPPLREQPGEGSSRQKTKKPRKEKQAEASKLKQASVKRRLQTHRRTRKP